MGRTKGLPGLNNISEEERQAFLLNNAEKLKKYEDDPELYNKASEILYNNIAFKSTFGEDAFHNTPSYKERNQMLKDKLVGDAFEKAYSPFEGKRRNNNKGLGRDWEKYAAMPTDAKEKLLNSEWKTPQEMEEEQKKRTSWYEKAIDFVAGEPIQQYKKDKNQKILDRIYNEVADNAATAQKDVVSAAYYTPDVVGRTDRETKELFKAAVTPSRNNMGISEYASHLDSPEMEDMSIDEMRQVLAKKAAYERTMSPELANTALNNEAKRYIKNHQSGLRRFGLFAKDVGIAAMSYTADKINGIYNLGLMAKDRSEGLPTVYVDDRGNVVDSHKNVIMQDKAGNLSYVDSEGIKHTVHRQQIARTTLHNMGKDEAGNDLEDTGADWMTLNPQYWSRAEQFGTLDEDEQKQYEKLGSSPYKVAYDPNEDTDLVYESFKMMSFGIADAASMLLPFGVGMAGRTLSTASKVGKLGRGMGTVLNHAGRALSSQTKFGQVSQGLVGAGGIAYAYQRGSFQETLAKNLEEAEEALLDRSKKDVYDLYHSDKAYKSQVDALINAEASKAKKAYIRQATLEGNVQILDEPALDEMLKARAQDAVIDSLVQQKIEENRGSQEYADLQRRAIDEAGNTATTTFLPEAVKYGLVNTVGFRKFLYKHPTSLAQKASKNFKGIVETETAEGTKRLTVPSKFATWKQKGKQLGRVVAGQMWGGAWTNGTDDMQVDAAERINEDKFSRYLRGYANAEAIADTYDLTDGIFSYLKGMHNSMGQTTTWDAATIGGFGGLVSFSPHMANIAHLASKEGRDAYQKNFKKRVKRDENGLIVRDSKGEPIMEDVSMSDNIGNRLAFFIQNGVLNEYYGRQQSEKALQDHADYVNSILDKHEDFEALEGLVASDLAYQNAESLKDAKTADFNKALNLIHVLKTLEKNETEPGLLSSTVQEKLALIDKASNITFENGEVQHDFTEEELQSLLGAYASEHPEMEREGNEITALQDIQKNAKKFTEAIEAYDEANRQISKIERSKGRPIDPILKSKILSMRAMNSHYKDRIQNMQKEIGDNSDIDAELSEDKVLSVIGGRKNAERLISIYDKQQEEIEGDIENKKQNITTLEDDLKKAKQDYKKANSSDDKYAAQQALNEASAALNNSIHDKEYLEKALHRTKEKRSKIQNALNSHEEGTPVKVLTADEIFALDPITRARMLNEENLGLYSVAQVEEIDKLKQRLNDHDEGDFQKIQDIAALQQVVKANSEGYSNIVKDPEAAAFVVEMEREDAARDAHLLSSKRVAEGISEILNMTTEVAEKKGEGKGVVNGMVYTQLRRQNAATLKFIEEGDLLPKYKQQVADAKEWRKTVDDIQTGLNKLPAAFTMEDRQKLANAINMEANKASDRNEFLSNLEKAIDTTNDETLAKMYNTLLDTMQDMGYQRDKAVIESREERKKREEEQKKREEEAKKKLAEETEAAKEKAEKEAERIAEEKAAIEKEIKEGEVSEEDENTIGTPAPEIDVEEAEKEATEGMQHHGEDIPTEEVFDLVSTFMEDDAEPGTLGMSTMWSKGSNPKLGAFNVTMVKGKNGNEITFTLDDSSEVLTVPSTDYAIPDEIKDDIEKENIPEGTSFNVKSIKNLNKEWYFEGTFAGSNKTFVLPVNKDFNLNDAIKNQKLQRESEAQASGASVNNPHFIVEGDAEYAVSPTLEDEIKEFKEEDKTTETIDDADEANENGEKSMNVSDATLSGMAMPDYQRDPLVDDHILKMKVEKNTVESKKVLEHYQLWMKAAKTSIQNIVDREIHKMLAKKAAKGEALKLKFMCVNPKKNTETHDDWLTTLLFLVVDYDSDISSVHDDKNGGVIESNGKKYLMVGVVGYGSVNDSKLTKEQREINLYRRDNLYNTIFGANSEHLGLLQKGKIKYFKDHPSERFRVLDDVATEIVPGTLIPGYLVKQLETDENNTTYRKVSELLEDERNPFTDIGFNDLQWGIQELSKFYSPIGSANIMVPRNTARNAGNTYLLIPASNGKLLPVALAATNYTDVVKNGESRLLNEINDALNKLTTPGTKEENYLVRRSGIDTLLTIFHFSKEGDNIVSKKDGTILFVKDGKDEATVDPSTSSNPLEEIKEALVKVNPRVNITPSVIRSRMPIYDEAGVLKTDCAFLHTVGSGYSIYPIDADGNMVVNDKMKVIVRQSRDTGYRNESYEKLHYDNKNYTYKVKTKEYFEEGHSEPVKNEKVLRDLEYNRLIVERGISYSDSKGGIEYYVIESGEHSKVIALNNSNHHITKELSEEESKNFIAEMKRKEEAKKRKEAAKTKLNERTPVDLEDFKVDEKTGDLGITDTVKDAREYLRSVGKDMQDAMNSSSDTELMESLVELADEAIKRAREIGVEESFINNINAIKAGLRTKFNNYKKAGLGQKEGKEGEETPAEKPKVVDETPLKAEGEPNTGSTDSGAKVDFKEFLKINKPRKSEIMKFLLDKFPDAPIIFNSERGVYEFKKDALTEFLKDKGAPITDIESTEAGYKVWKHKIECL